MAIPEKLENIKSVKTEIKEILDSTNQNTNVSFRQYCNLIANIPNRGVLTPRQINDLTSLVINISGERA